MNAAFLLLNVLVALTLGKLLILVIKLYSTLRSVGAIYDENVKFRVPNASLKMLKETVIANNCYFTIHST